MASSSHGGTPNVTDVRRARAARFSFSPAQDFGSPSFSLGLEKCTAPPSFDGCCGEKDVQEGDEKQNGQRKRLPDRAAAPSFSLGLEDIQAPLSSEDSREKENPDRRGRWFSQGQEQHSREAQQVSFSAILDDTPASSKSNKCSNTDSLKPAEERWISQGRSSKGFSGPSFSLGLETGCSPGKCNDAYSGEEKQADDLARSFGDLSKQSSLGAEHPSVPKSSLFQLSSEEPGGDPESTLLQDSLTGDSSSPKSDLSLVRSEEVFSKLIKLKGRTSALSPSLVEKKTVRSPKSNSSVKSSEEQPAKERRRSARLLPRAEHTESLKTEPCSNSSVTRRTNDQEVQRKSLGLESTSPEPKKSRPTSRSESSLRSHEDQMVEHRLFKEGCTSLHESGEHSLASKTTRGFITNGFSSNGGEQNLEELLELSMVPRADGSTKAAAKATSARPVGPIARKEEVQEYVGKIGERLPLLPPTHFPQIIDLSPEKGEKPSPEQLKWSPGCSKEDQGTPQYKVPVEMMRHSQEDNQQTEMGKVHVVDVSTPPGGLASRPVTNSHRRTGSEVFMDSEEELEVYRIPKRRRLSKPCFQVKLEPPSTNCLEDLTCPPTDGAGEADERTPGTPSAEQKKLFKRLRRGSSAKDSLVKKAPSDRIDQNVASTKVKLDPSDPFFGPKVQVHLSVDEFGEQITGTSQDEFDDIEDSSEHELHVAGSRPHRHRRYLKTQIIPKKLSLSTPSPAGVKKPVLHIPGLDTSVVPQRQGKAKGESVTCLDKRFSSNLAKETGNIKAEPITLSDDEEPWPATSRSRVLRSRTFPAEVGKGFTSSDQNPNLVPEYERAVSGSNDSRRKGKSPIMDGSDLWKSYTEDFSADGNAGLGGPVTDASSSVYKRCQSEDVRISDLLRERLPHFKPVEALLLDGGLDQEPVYIDYKNQFGRSQGMDSAALAELDCTQPQTRRKQRRPSSKVPRGRKAYASTSANVSSQRTSAGKSPSKGRRKAWTLFRERKGRATTSGSTSEKGYWIQENGRRVYVQDGRTLTGRSAYGAYKKDCGKRSRKTRKKLATKAER